MLEFLKIFGAKKSREIVKICEKQHIWKRFFNWIIVRHNKFGEEIKKHETYAA